MLTRKMERMTTALCLSLFMLGVLKMKKKVEKQNSINDLTFGDYLAALKSGNISEWVLEHKTNKGEFSLFKAKAILKRAFSEEEQVEAEKKYNVYFDVDSLVLGQFIAIETGFSNKSMDAADRLLNVALNVIRPTLDLHFDNENVEKEQRHRNDILNEKSQYVLRIIGFFRLKCHFGVFVPFLHFRCQNANPV